VIAQVGLLGKSLLTVVADVLLVRRMVPYVVQQRCFPVEDLLAKWALSLLSQQNLTVHVDQRLFKFKRR
jgi:hypothetical protein